MSDVSCRVFTYFHEGAPAGGLLALDLTERQQMEAKLRDSEETMAALMTTLPDLIVRLDPDGLLLDSQGGTIMRRVSAIHSARGRNVRDLVGVVPGLTHELLAPGLAAVRDSIADRKVRQLEHDVSYEDGSHRVFEVRIVPIAARPEVLGIIRDVTRRRAEERQLAISDRMISLGTLAAGVAHEINNPLTYVMGSLSELDQSVQRLRGGASAIDIASMQPALDQAREGVARVTAIVRSLGSVSRIDIRHVEPLDIHDMLEQAVSITVHELRQRARLVRAYDATGLVMVDRVQLVQVLVNLLANAIQSIPDGKRDDNEIRLVTGESADLIWLEVQDTGEGIPPADLARVFDPFFTTKPRGHGTGLGLAISHRIVGDLGGVLTAHSIVGKGTSLRIELPRPVASAARSTAPPTNVPAPVPANASILIVDDEPALAEMARRALVDWRPDVVHSGREALARLSGNAEYDLVLCDITMPELTGVDVYEQATQAHPKLAGRFLFMCGGVTTDRAQRFLDDVAPPVLWKPFDSSELKNCVGSLLSAMPTAI